MTPIKQLIPLLLLLAVTLSPLISRADGSLNTRQNHQPSPVVQPSHDYRSSPHYGYQYRHGGNDIIIIHRNRGYDGNDIYQRNRHRHRYRTSDQPAVDRRPMQCLGNHCGNE